MSCAACPCPGTCLAWPAFCAWAAESPPVESNIRHIRARSALGPDPYPTTTAPPPDPTSLAAVAESLALLRATKACPFRAAGPGCGCGGARCALKSGAIVSHIDCMDCARRFG